MTEIFVQKILNHHKDVHMNEILRIKNKYDDLKYSKENFYFIFKG